MDFQRHARNMLEAAALLGDCGHAHLQRIQNLLAGRLHHAQGVAEGMDHQDIVQGDVTRVNGHANAAAVDKGDVRAGLIQIRVRAQVAKVGLRTADDADIRRRVVDRQIHLGSRNYFIQLFVQRLRGRFNRRSHVVLNAKQFRRGNLVVPGIQAAGQRAIRANAQVAHALQLRAAGCSEHLLAFLVEHLSLIHVMAVAVKQRVNAGRIGNHIGIGPRTAIRLVAQMRHRDDIRRALGARAVHRALHSSIQLFAGFILHKAIYEFARFVLEVLGRGRGQRLGRGHADKGDLNAVKRFDHIRRKHQFALLVEVGADVGELRSLRQFQEAIHAIVKLMVARNGDVVAHSVHQLHIGAAGGHRTNRFALNGVAIVNQQHMVARRLHRVADGRHAYIAKALLNAAMHVAGKEHHHVLLKAGRLLRKRRAGQQHAQHQNKTEPLFHCTHILSISVFIHIQTVFCLSLYCNPYPISTNCVHGLRSSCCHIACLVV